MDLGPLATTDAVRRFSSWLRGRLGRAVLATYAAALLAPWPGQWLREPHPLPLVHLSAGLRVPPVLLGVLLFAAGFQVRATALSGLLRRPLGLLAALSLHLALPLVLIPALVLLLRGTPDADHGSGIVTAMVLIVAMPVAANATVWTAKGDGDQPAMVATVLGSTLLSPLTTPVVIAALGRLVRGGYADRLAVAARAAHGGLALTGIVLPCAAGVLCRAVLRRGRCGTWESGVGAAGLLASLGTTYVNASGALGPCLAHPRPLLVAACVVTAAGVCVASFVLGSAAGAVLRLNRGGRSSLALACGMNNSSAGAVLISTALPDKPYLLMPVLTYGLVQKSVAGLVVRGARPAPSASPSR
ncbi:sodium-dependent transporter [Streptomyces sp. NPDC088785]|uniref:sodium-dependent transporter n=1 Tax=Streptomyces sp. NPDC088785 TaxID=3365897 RepID=UPI0037F8706B